MLTKKPKNNLSGNARPTTKLVLIPTKKSVVQLSVPNHGAKAYKGPFLSLWCFENLSMNNLSRGLYSWTRASRKTVLVVGLYEVVHQYLKWSSLKASHKKLWILCTKNVQVVLMCIIFYSMQREIAVPVWCHGCSFYLRELVI